LLSWNEEKSEPANVNVQCKTRNVQCRGEEGETDVDRRRNFDLEERLISFAVRIIGVVEALPDTRTGSHVAGQLVRCGSAAGPNYAEAQAAESRSDFIHKMKICLKELREARVWLMIIHRKPLIEPPGKLDSLIAGCNELIAIFASSIATVQKNRATKAKVPTSKVEQALQ
jgi:four helix bundle protein